MYINGAIMILGYPELAILCRDVSINHENDYQVCCDYYGVLDEVHIMVSDRGFRNHVYCKINVALKLSGDEMNQQAIDDTIKELQALACIK